MLSRFPAPQFWAAFPGQEKLHSSIETPTLPGLMVLLQ